MRRIGITQRVDTVRGERRDALDQAWHSILDDLGWLGVPLPNSGDPGMLCQELALDAILLTGGNDIDALDGAQDSAPERDSFEASLLDHAAAHALPVFGVCRGAQFLNHHLGGRLEPIEGHVRVQHAVHGPWGRARVNSYHGYGIAPDGLAQPLQAMATDDDGHVEAFQHTDLPWAGIFWHPEREEGLLPEDRQLLEAILGGRP